MSSTGRRLRESNEEILKYISQLRQSRDELVFLIEKQKTEKANLETESARIAYKLNLIGKSLSQRMHALALYDQTLREIESKYKGLADCTQGLLTQVRKESNNLENSIDKKTGTESDDCERCQPCLIAASPSGKRAYHHVKHTMRVLSNLEEMVLKSKDPLYTLTMEYPMVLSSILNEDILKETLVLPIERRDTEDSKIPTKDISESKPCRDNEISSNRTVSNKTSVSNITASSQGTPSTASDSIKTPNGEEPNIKKHSKVSNGSEACKQKHRESTPGDDSTEDAKKEIVKVHSVDDFKQGYRRQHVKDEHPTSVAQYRQSVQNKRLNSIGTKETS